MGSFLAEPNAEALMSNSEIDLILKVDISLKFDPHFLVNLGWSDLIFRSRILILNQRQAVRVVIDP